MNWLNLTGPEISAIWLSIKVGLVSSVVTLPLAIFFAWILARKKFPGKPALDGLLHLPLVAPPVVTGFLLLIILGRNGFIGRFFAETLHIDLAFSFWAAAIAAIVVSLPLATRTIKTSFELINPDYEEAARTLGANRWQTFFRVSLPLAYPGVISGFVLAFARSLGEFGATIVFAGNIEGKTQTLALAIFSNMQTPGAEMETMRLVVFSLIISFAAIAASEYYHRKIKYF